MEPVKNYRISSPYGNRILNGVTQFHDGIDFVSREKGNTDVFSIGPGVCTFDFDHYDDKKRWADTKHSAGNYVIIKTTIGDKEYHIRYLHLKENTLSNGQKVAEGEKIGEFADVGFSFGAHLHLDMYDMAWKKIDPTPIIKSII